jgi:hypothetical protein
MFSWNSQKSKEWKNNFLARLQLLRLSSFSLPQLFAFFVLRNKNFEKYFLTTQFQAPKNLQIMFFSSQLVKLWNVHVYKSSK